MKHLQIKQDVFSACKTYITNRIDSARKAMDEAQEAANEETKGSVGDKHETGRAMMQIERDKYARQLADALEQNQALSQININNKADLIRPGHLIGTDNGCFFIAIAAGKVLAGSMEVITLAPQSPLGRAMLGKKIKDLVEYNGRTYLIQEIT